MSVVPQISDLPADTPSIGQKRFTWRHVFTLVFAVTLSLAIVAMSPWIGTLRHYGYWGLFAAMVISNATLILPTPGIVLNVVMGSALPNPLLVGLAAGIGSTLGEVIGYALGYSSSGLVKSTKAYERIHAWIKKFGLIIIFLMALIPNPLFDLAGVAAGALGIKWWKFLIVTALGKTIRAIFLAYFGEWLV